MNQTETSLARIFAICDQVAESGEPIKTEAEAQESAESFLGLIPVVTQYPCGPPVEPLTVHPDFQNDKARPPSQQRMVRRKQLRREGMSFRTQDERMARLVEQLEEAHGSLALARIEAVLLREPCAEELFAALECVQSAIEQTLPPNDPALRARSDS